MCSPTRRCLQFWRANSFRYSFNRSFLSLRFMLHISRYLRILLKVHIGCVNTLDFPSPRVSYQKLAPQLSLVISLQTKVRLPSDVIESNHVPKSPSNVIVLFRVFFKDRARDMFSNIWQSRGATNSKQELINIQSPKTELYRFIRSYSKT